MDTELGSVDRGADSYTSTSSLSCNPVLLRDAVRREEACLPLALGIGVRVHNTLTLETIYSKEGSCTTSREISQLGSLKKFRGFRTTPLRNSRLQLLLH